MFRFLFFPILLCLSMNALQAQNTLSISDVKPWAGVFGGSLTYKDYTNNEIVSMPLVAAVETKDNTLDIEIRLYEWGGKYKQHYKYRFDGATLKMDGSWTLETSGLVKDGELPKAVYTRRGKDGNDRRACTFRLTLEGTKDAWQIRKEVKFDDEPAFFVRNTYSFERVSI
jgi:hypothetical protein